MNRTSIGFALVTSLVLAFGGYALAAPLPGVLPGLGTPPAATQPVTPPPPVRPIPVQPLPVEPPSDENTDTGEDADGTPTIMIGSVAAIGTFIVDRGDSGILVTRVETTDLSARWYILQSADDDEKAMLCNVKDPLLCLVERNGKVELGDVGPDDSSGQWIATGVGGEKLRIQSVSNPILFLSRRDTLDLELAQDDAANPAQQWWMQL